MDATLSPTREITLFTRAEAIDAGYKDRDLAGPQFQRVIHGIYTYAGIELTHELKCRAAAIVLPRDGIITGRSAATLRGIPLAGPNDNVEVLVGDHKYMNRRFGLRCWSRQSRDDEHVGWRGVRLATPDRIGYDLLARNGIRYGVANCDALLHAGFVNGESLTRFLSSRKYYGTRKAWRALQLVDGRSESIPESVLRVTLVLGGLNPVPQLVVVDEHVFVARVDLGFEAEKVALEYDGAWHGDPVQHKRDQARLARLRDCGWQVIVVTATRLHNDPIGIVEEVKAALRHRQ